MTASASARSAWSRTERVQHPLRRSPPGASGSAITGLDNSLQSGQVRLWGEVESQRADAYDFNIYHYYENVPAVFSLPKNVLVREGTYNWTNIAPKIQTTTAR